MSYEDVTLPHEVNILIIFLQSFQKIIKLNTIFVCLLISLDAQAIGRSGFFSSYKID